MSARPEDLSKNLNFVGGEFVASVSSKTFLKSDPSTGLPNAEIPDSDLMDVVRAIQAGNKALLTWTKTTVQERAVFLETLAALIETRAQDFARTLARDLGTPVSQTLEFSIPDAVSACRANAKIFNEPDVRGENGFQTPVGLVAILLPASDPLVCLASRVTSALAAGNAVIVKVSSRTPETGVLFSELIREAGIPAGVYACLQGHGSSVGEAVVQHPGISTLAFMGSTEVGRRINVMAAENLKRVHLSLGAKNPVLLFNSVDLDVAIPKVAKICLGLFPARAYQGSRLFVQEMIFKEVLERLKAEFDRLRVGLPLDPSTQLGPLATEAAALKFRDAVTLAKKENGRVVTSANAVQEQGNFVQPVLFADLTNCSTLQQDEIVGPLVLASSFKYQHEALKHANVSPFGRAAFIFEADPEKAERVATKVEAGRIFLNSSKPFFDTTRPQPLLKHSGSMDESVKSLATFFSRLHLVNLN